MNKYYFTFGVGQPNRKHYKVIYAKDHEAARELMFKHYGKEWCWQYNEKQWAVVLKNCPPMRDYEPLEPAIYQQE